MSGSPAAARRVGIQSSCEKISLIFVPGFDHTWPTHDHRDAQAAFPSRSLFAVEWRNTAIRPGCRLGTVVGAVYKNRVVSQAEVVELLQHLSDVAIVFDHAVGIRPMPVLPCDSFFRCVQTCMRVLLYQRKNGCWL